MIEQNKTLEKAFEKTLSGLEIKTKKGRNIHNLFGLLGRTSKPFVQVNSGEEIKLEAAREIFDYAYNMVIHDDYDAHVIRVDPAVEYFFAEGIKFARESQRKD